ncbi:MAG: peptidase domain-containing ABC transporter [Hydrogenophaga sp.]
MTVAALGAPSAVPAAVLQRLLVLLDVQLPEARVAAACEKAARLPDAHPVMRLRMALGELGLPWLLPAAVAWMRFDTSALPALLWHDGQWSVVQAGNAPGQVRLQDGQGLVRDLGDGDLASAMVLWLRRTRTAAGRSASPGGQSMALRWVLKELFRSPGWIVRVMVATVLINLFAVFTSIFAMQVYDRVVPTLAYTTLTTLVAGMVLVVVVDWALKLLRGQAMDRMAARVDRELSQRVFDHLVHLRLDLMPRGVGQLSAQVNGMEQVRNFLSSSVMYALVDLPFVLMFIAFIALIGGQVAMVYVLLLPVALALAFFSHWRQRAITRQLMQQGNERTGVLVDAIRGAESIRAANAMQRVSQQWQGQTAQIADKSRQQKGNQTLTLANTQALSTVAYVAALVVGVMEIESGRLSMGALIACSILGGRVIGPVAQGVQLLSQWYGVARSLEQVDAILQIEQERRPGQDLLVTDERPASVELERVTFCYPQSAVKQVRVEHLRLNAGDRVLLLGPIGCGKSTLLKVLAGLYRPGEGRVRLGAMDLWEMDPQVVAGMMGYLPQSVHLFKGSLRSNLAAAGVRDDTRLAEAARAFGVESIADDSPQGMETEISEGGEGLSGGQRQLIGLARLAVAAPRVWLLDEPTSALDAKTEGRIWAALQRFVAPQDILVVATHRPMAAMPVVNRVLMMQKGAIVKDGTPDEVVPQLAANARAQQQAMARARAAQGRPLAGGPDAGVDDET